LEHWQGANYRTEGARARWWPRNEILVPSIQISTADTLRYAAEALGAAPEVDVVLERNRGGRPPVHDWMEAQAQAIERIWERGLPTKKSELTAELGEWFDARGGPAPDDRGIEKKVTEWWPLLERLAAGGRCELKPKSGG
jgi:hypothetical protein